MRQNSLYRQRQLGQLGVLQRRPGNDALLPAELALLVQACERKNEICAERPVLLTIGTANVYMYCDLLEHVMVRDNKAPPLRIVSRKMAVLRVDDKVEHTAFNSLQYVLLQKKSFDTIDILLATDYGELLPFVPGKAIVVLEFRRMVHPYLLL